MLFFLVDLDFLRVLQDVRMYCLVDELTSATCHLQDEIVEGGATKDIDVVRCTSLARQSAQTTVELGLPVFGPPLGLNLSGSCFISYVLICTPAGL